MWRVRRVGTLMGRGMMRSWMGRSRMVGYRASPFLAFFICLSLIYPCLFVVVCVSICVMWRVVAQINAPPPFTPSHEEPYIIHGWLPPEHTDGDVGAFEGLCVPQASNERRAVYRRAQRVRS